jgi:hypothetical protein
VAVGDVEVAAEEEEEEEGKWTRDGQKPPAAASYLRFHWLR